MQCPGPPLRREKDKAPKSKRGHEGGPGRDCRTPLPPAISRPVGSSPKEAGTEQAVGECLLPPLSAKKTLSTVS